MNREGNGWVVMGDDVDLSDEEIGRLVETILPFLEEEDEEENDDE